MSELLALLPEYLTGHLQLSLLALGIGIAISVPTGIWLTRRFQDRAVTLAEWACRLRELHCCCQLLRSALTPGKYDDPIRRPLRRRQPAGRRVRPRPGPLR